MAKRGKLGKCFHILKATNIKTARSSVRQRGRDEIESCLYISRCETKVHYVIQSARSLVQQKVFAFFSYQKQGGWTIVQIQQSRHRMNIPGTKAERIHLSGNLYIMVTIRSISAPFIFPTKMKN